MEKILLVNTRRVSAIQLQRFPFQLFPPHVIDAARRYRFDEELRNDPAEYQRIYEELKVEAALLVIVCFSTLLAWFRTLSLFH